MLYKLYIFIYINFILFLTLKILSPTLIGEGKRKMRKVVEAYETPFFFEKIEVFNEVIFIYFYNENFNFYTNLRDLGIEEEGLVFPIIS